jgi:hypothetical protein
MKKTSIKYIILFVTGFLLMTQSCTNLDETVYSELISENLVYTEKDIPNLIAPPYVKFRDFWYGWNAMLYANEESSDCMAIPGRPNGWGDLYVPLHLHQWTDEHGYVEGCWWYMFNMVTFANQAISQLKTIEGVDVTSYISEMRGLRALAYYYLLDYYRNVPIVTEAVGDLPDKYLPEQNTAAQIFDFIEDELLAIIPTLSEKKDASTNGRFTKWAAKMTLARLYMMSEAYGFGPRYTDAQAQVQDIIDSQKFSLAANPLDPFKSDNDNNSEAILAIPLDEVFCSFYAYPSRTLNGASKATFNLGRDCWGGTGMLPQFINTYDPDDERLGAYLGGPQYDYLGNPIMVDGAQLNYVNRMSTIQQSGFFEGWRCVKYEIRLGLTTYPGNDLQFYRYTEALMIKAECLLRTGHADEAAAIVTEVRARAFTSNPAKATVTGAQLQAGSSYQYGNLEGDVMSNYQGGADITYGRFLDELGWEFVFEGHRKQDLVRFGVYNRKAWFSKQPSDPSRAYFPIPKSQLQANKNLKQNDGYN